jgi:hypothetical protein
MENLTPRRKDAKKTTLKENHDQEAAGEIDAGSPR